MCVTGVAAAAAAASAFGGACLGAAPVAPLHPPPPEHTHTLHEHHTHTHTRARAPQYVVKQLALYPNSISVPLMENFGVPLAPKGMIHVRLHKIANLKSTDYLTKGDAYVVFEVCARARVCVCVCCYVVLQAGCMHAAAGCRPHCSQVMATALQALDNKRCTHTHTHTQTPAQTEPHIRHARAARSAAASSRTAQTPSSTRSSSCSWTTLTSSGCPSRCAVCLCVGCACARPSACCQQAPACGCLAGRCTATHISATLLCHTLNPHSRHTLITPHSRLPSSLSPLSHCVGVRL
jgi:hypothetical protein